LTDFLLESGWRSILIHQALFNLLHILGDGELARSDEVDVVDGVVALGVYLLPAVELLLVQVVIDPRDRIRPQFLKDSVIL